MIRIACIHILIEHICVQKFYKCIYVMVCCEPHTHASTMLIKCNLYITDFLHYKQIFMPAAATYLTIHFLSNRYRHTHTGMHSYNGTFIHTSYIMHLLTFKWHLHLHFFMSPIFYLPRVLLYRTYTQSIMWTTHGVLGCNWQPVYDSMHFINISIWRRHRENPLQPRMQ